MYAVNVIVITALSSQVYHYYYDFHRFVPNN